MLKTKSQRIEHLFELVHKEGFSITEPSFDLLGAIFSGSDELRQALKDSQVIKKEDLLKAVSYTHLTLPTKRIV